MTSTPKKTLTGLILDDNCLFTLEEMSKACSVRIEFIIELVDEGIVEPMQRQRNESQWSFTGRSLMRVRKARRLQQDLGINLAGIALVLDMLEENERLRERLRRLL